MSEKRKRRFISPLAVAESNTNVAVIRCRWKSGGGMNYSNAITIRQLEVMNAIAVSGSIRKAAKLLGLSQPTVSAQLAKLEDDLGTQLVHRDRQRSEVLTGAGELWASTARTVLSDLEEGRGRHCEQFGQKQCKISFATIPSHAGRIWGLAAAQAHADPRISEFSIELADSSTTLLEYLAIRKASIGLMVMTEGLRETTSLKYETLYEDRILWAVPKSVDPKLAIDIINSNSISAPLPQALKKRVAVRAPHEWSAKSNAWYKSRLASAAPYFTSDLHVGAIEIVAANLGTCHLSMTLHSNLPDRLHKDVAFYDTGCVAQKMVLAMPRHLMMVPTFASYFERLAEAVRDDYTRYFLAHAVDFRDVET